MPRIIAGTLGGRRISPPPSSQTRPTSDRIREAIFARLDSWDVLVGAKVLDLYAGTGALGFEALSRGAVDLVSVEAHAGTAKVIDANARELNVASATTVSVKKLSARNLPGVVARTLIFADPPYDVTTEELATILEGLAADRAFADEATVVVERSSRTAPLALSDAFVDEGAKTTGDTRVEYFTYLDPSFGAAEG